MKESQEIIKEFQGDIDVKSVKGHGTVFSIVLPLPQKKTLLIESQPGEKE